MAVPCPRCGREYDVTRFEFGRTLWCTCGSRVGLAPQERRLAEVPRRFFADAMLGRLARWLRLLGFDCAWQADITDEDLVRRALFEGRIALTRDRSLLEDWRVSNLYRVEAENTREQLAEVVRKFGLADEIRVLSRCSRCNEMLVAAAAEQVALHVPPRVLERHADYAACPACGRIYWQGSHARRICDVVDDLLAGAAEDLGGREGER
jgi:uncharacterized protein with PIN domain